MSGNAFGQLDLQHEMGLATPVGPLHSRTARTPSSDRVSARPTPDARAALPARARWWIVTAAHRRAPFRRRVHRDVQIRYRRPRRRHPASRNCLRPRPGLLVHRVQQRDGAVAHGEPDARRAAVPMADRQHGGSTGREQQRSPRAGRRGSRLRRYRRSRHRLRRRARRAKCRKVMSRVAASARPAPGAAGGDLHRCVRAGPRRPARRDTVAPSTGRILRACARSFPTSP